MRERAPAVAGRFYPADAQALAAQVQTFLGAAGGSPRRLVGLVAPHAGYVYSGAVAGAVFGVAEVPPCVVLLGPNHTGRGERASLRARGDWLLPGGRVPVDEVVSDAILRMAQPLVRADVEAHVAEHCLEVLLPFLVARNPNVRIVPLCLGGLSVDECRTLAAVLDAVLPEQALVVASSDMSHYLSDTLTRQRDELAITPLVACDADALYEVVEREDLSMCGYVPATVLLAYARARGAVGGELIRYGTSGDASGDRSRVVGYAAIAFPAA